MQERIILKNNIEKKWERKKNAIDNDDEMYTEVNDYLR